MKSARMNPTQALKVIKSKTGLTTKTLVYAPAYYKVKDYFVDYKGYTLYFMVHPDGLTKFNETEIGGYFTLPIKEEEASLFSLVKKYHLEWWTEDQGNDENNAPEARVYARDVARRGKWHKTLEAALVFIKEQSAKNKAPKTLYQRIKEHAATRQKAAAKKKVVKK